MAYGYQAIIILNDADQKISRVRTMAMTVTSAGVRNDLRTALSNGDKQIDDIFQIIENGEEGYSLPSDIIMNADIDPELGTINNHEVNSGCIADMIEIRNYMRVAKDEFNLNISLYVEMY